MIKPNKNTASATKAETPEILAKPSRLSLADSGQGEGDRANMNIKVEQVDHEVNNDEKEQKNDHPWEPRTPEQNPEQEKNLEQKMDTSLNFLKNLLQATQKLNDSSFHSWSNLSNKSLTNKVIIDKSRLLELEYTEKQASWLSKENELLEKRVTTLNCDIRYYKNRADRIESEVNMEKDQIEKQGKTLTRTIVGAETGNEMSNHKCHSYRQVTIKKRKRSFSGQSRPRSMDRNEYTVDEYEQTEDNDVYIPSSPTELYDHPEPKKSRSRHDESYERERSTSKRCEGRNENLFEGDSHEQKELYSYKIQRHVTVYDDSYRPNDRQVLVHKQKEKQVYVSQGRFENKLMELRSERFNITKPRPRRSAGPSSVTPRQEQTFQNIPLYPKIFNTKDYDNIYKILEDQMIAQFRYYNNYEAVCYNGKTGVENLRNFLDNKLKTPNIKNYCYLNLSDSLIVKIDKFMKLDFFDVPVCALYQKNGIGGLANKPLIHYKNRTPKHHPNIGILMIDPYNGLDGCRKGSTQEYYLGYIVYGRGCHKG